MKKSAIIISCFNWYNARLKYVKEILEKQNYSVKIYIADFDHMKKLTLINKEKDCDYIHVKPYTKNISVQRLISHYGFSIQMSKILNRSKPELIYALIPPNSVSWICGRYKKKYPHTKLFYDVIDLWPETIFNNKNNLIESFFAGIWKYCRDKYINQANHIFTECSLYQRELKNISELKKVSTLYLCKEKFKIKSNINNLYNFDIVSLCYLGSINNIIDISMITCILKQIRKHKPVILHIIGDGEKKTEFISSMESIDIDIVYHGLLFDEEKKHEIFSICHFGLNIMKESVCVGLTIKSLDYFEAGLPILNNIPYDTAELITKYNIGYNITYNNVNITAKMISESNIVEYSNMRKNTLEVFNNYFTKEKFYNDLNKYI